MSSPYFDFKENDDFNIVRDIILADKEVKHFVRKRIFAPNSYDDIESDFNNFVLNYTDGVFFKLLCLFAILSLVMLALLWFLRGFLWEMFGIIFVALLFFALFLFFLIYYLKERELVKTIDDLYLMYDKEGFPIAIEVRKTTSKVLYKNTLYLIKDEKIKVVKKEKQIYYAYLNMYPQSVLDMNKYVDNSDKSTDVKLTPNAKFLQNGYCKLYFGDISRHWQNHVKFDFYMFIVNNEIKLDSIYSVAKENFLLCDNILTYAKITEIGETAEISLRNIVSKNILLFEVLDRINFE